MRCVILLFLLCFAAAAGADASFSIVTPQWVADHNSDADMRILDVRQDSYEYFAGHVPNSVHFADGSLRCTKKGVPVQYLPPDTLALLFSRSGIAPNSRVVIYSDGAGVLGATMTAYVLLKLGIGPVMVMDGGWSAYRAAGLPVSQRYPDYTTAVLRGRDDKSMYVTLDQVRGFLADGGIRFVDARPPKSYAGAVTTWMRNGHIPGAVSIDWHLLTDTANPHRFKTPAEMQAVLDSRGVDRTDDVVVYCGTSREATLEYLVVKHVLGYPKVRLYEGSWTEYSSTDLPVEKSAGP